MTTPKTEQATRFDLPGFTLPLDWKPARRSWELVLFPCALDEQSVEEGWVSHLKTVRELTMMQIMNVISEKPNWEDKIYNTEITSKWTEEILQSGKDVSPKMFEWIWDELKYKARIMKDVGMITAFNPGVLRSDTAISKELQKALQTAVLPLEHVPERDYHPGSDEKVIDLVHPSLFPVVYGRTPILRDEIITRDDCWSWAGKAEVLARPLDNDSRLRPENHGPFGFSELKAFSTKFQWLPCDIEFVDNGECRIVSYINNLHPQKHDELYRLIEKIIDKAIPLWDESLEETRNRTSDRIEYENVEYLPFDEPEPKWTGEDSEDDEDDDFYRTHKAWCDARPIKQPEPEGSFKPLYREHPRRSSHVRLRDDFRDSGLQIIVKLANIELTPDKPHYEGGTWHVEGQLNERICATAIYYYSMENITDSHLSFRQRSENVGTIEVSYEQDQHAFMHQIYGFEPTDFGYDHVSVTQELGNVSSVEGRLLTFPNILQHRVAPFELADKSKPGHRKILALFLVDPNMRIISSANVPPQRADWWAERDNLRRVLLGQRLPLELQEMIMQDMDGEPMTMDEAKDLRLELMEERKAAHTEQSKAFEMGTFSLCEH